MRSAAKPRAHQVVAGRVGDDLEVAAPIDATDRLLRRIDDGRDGRVDLLEDRRAHQVRDHREHGRASPERAVEGDLVDVVEDDVGGIGAHEAAVEEGDDEGEVELVAATHDAVAVGVLDRPARRGSARSATCSGGRGGPGGGGSPPCELPRRRRAGCVDHASSVLRHARRAGTSEPGAGRPARDVCGPRGMPGGAAFAPRQSLGAVPPGHPARSGASGVVDARRAAARPACCTSGANSGVERAEHESAAGAFGAVGARAGLGAAEGIARLTGEWLCVDVAGSRSRSRSRFWGGGSGRICGAGRRSVARGGCRRRWSRTDERGFLNPGRPIEKPAGTARILLLGGNVPQALGVPWALSMAGMLEGRADARRGRRLEVVNGAMSSFGIDQDLGLLRAEGARVAPDLVLAVVDPVVELTALTPELIGLASMRAPGKPYFDVVDGRLVPRDLPAPEPFAAASAEPAADRSHGARSIGLGRGLSPDPGVPQGVVARPAAAHRHGGRECTRRSSGAERSCGELRDEATRLGARLALVLVPPPREPRFGEITTTHRMLDHGWRGRRPGHQSRLGVPRHARAVRQHRLHPGHDTLQRRRTLPREPRHLDVPRAREAAARGRDAGARAGRRARPAAVAVPGCVVGGALRWSGPAASPAPWRGSLAARAPALARGAAAAADARLGDGRREPRPDRVARRARAAPAWRRRSPARCTSSRRSGRRGRGVSCWRRSWRRSSCCRSRGWPSSPTEVSVPLRPYVGLASAMSVWRLAAYSAERQRRGRRAPLVDYLVGILFAPTFAGGPLQSVWALARARRTDALAPATMAALGRMLSRAGLGALRVALGTAKLVLAPLLLGLLTPDVIASSGAAVDRSAVVGVAVRNDRLSLGRLQRLERRRCRPRGDGRCARAGELPRAVGGGASERALAPHARHGDGSASAGWSGRSDGTAARRAGRRVRELPGGCALACTVGAGALRPVRHAAGCVGRARGVGARCTRRVSWSATACGVARTGPLARVLGFAATQLLVALAWVPFVAFPFGTVGTIVRIYARLLGFR